MRRFYRAVIQFVADCIDALRDDDRMTARWQDGRPRGLQDPSR